MKQSTLSLMGFFLWLGFFLTLCGVIAVVIALRV